MFTLSINIIAVNVQIYTVVVKKLLVLYIFRNDFNVIKSKLLKT